MSTTSKLGFFCLNVIVVATALELTALHGLGRAEEKVVKVQSPKPACACAAKARPATTEVFSVICPKTLMFQASGIYYYYAWQHNVDTSIPSCGQGAPCMLTATTPLNSANCNASDPENGCIKVGVPGFRGEEKRRVHYAKPEIIRIPSRVEPGFQLSFRNASGAVIPENERITTELTSFFVRFVQPNSNRRTLAKVFLLSASKRKVDPDALEPDVIIGVGVECRSAGGGTVVDLGETVQHPDPETGLYTIAVGGAEFQIVVAPPGE